MRGGTYCAPIVLPCEIANETDNMASVGALHEEWCYVAIVGDPLACATVGSRPAHLACLARGCCEMLLLSGTRIAITARRVQVLHRVHGRSLRHQVPGSTDTISPDRQRSGGGMRRETDLINHVSTRSSWLFVVAAVLLGGRGAALADARGVFRIGVEPLGLEPSPDTPLVGDRVDEAVTAYNAAATAYNRAHGYAAGSAMASASIDRSDLGLHTTLVTFAPGFEVGGDHVMFRMEGLLGISDRLHAFGLGIYPIDLALPLQGGAVTPYLVAGGTLRWLDHSDHDGESGGLVTVRAAAGARIGRHVVVELGVGLYMLGGVYNGDQLQSMTRYDPRGSAPPPAPDRVVAGGEQTGMVDVSVGFAL